MMWIWRGLGVSFESARVRTGKTLPPVFFFRAACLTLEEHLIGNQRKPHHSPISLWRDTYMNLPEGGKSVVSYRKIQL